MISFFYNITTNAAAAARLYRVALQNYLVDSPRNTIVR